MKKNKLNNFKENGFFFNSINQNKNNLIKLRKNWISIFDKISQAKLNKRIKNEKDIIDLYFSKNRNIWVNVYDLLHLDPLLYKIASSNEMSQIIRKAGIKSPHYGTRPYVRVDMPNDLKFSRFRAHQDFPYNKHSKNSVVIWIPLQNTNYELGCLRFWVGSHVKNKIYKYDKKKIIINRKKINFRSFPCKFGQSIIFSQFLVHESGENFTDKIRFSIQFRVTDLNSKEYALRNFPVVR